LFTEILRIRPVLDRANAAAMERNLNQRFGRVARRFGQGLRNVVRGSVFGIGLTFLTRLLNPIKALEERIKSVLGQSDEIRDLADEFGTSPGQLQRLQFAGQSLRVNPDQLRDLMRSFARSVETGREEIAGGKEVSPITKTLQNFLGDEDMAESFFAFLASLRAASPEIRQAVEKGVFGGRQHGAVRRLIDSDLTEQMAKINAPTVEKLDQAINKLADIEAQRRVLEVQRETESLLGAARNITPSMVEQMEGAARAEAQRENRELQQYNTLRQAANDVQIIVGYFQSTMVLVQRGLGYLGRIVSVLETFKDSRVGKGIFKFFGSGN